MKQHKIKHTSSLYRKRKNISPMIPALLMLATAAIIALIGAGCWQYLQHKDDPGKKEPPVISSEMEESSLPPSEPDEPSSTIEESEAASSASTKEEEPINDPGTYYPSSHAGVSKEALGTIVKISERVDSTYFDDAAFVGDSLTNGIKAYGLMENSTIVANTGINLETFFTSQKINTPNGYVTALQALKADNPKKIYVMLGANGMAWYSKDQFVKLYTAVLDAIIEQHPDSIIYVQSILPVTKGYSDQPNGISNEKIDEYNDSLIELAYAKGLPYVDISECFKNASGALPTEASPNDGMHFGPTYYNKWFDYLKTHTVSN